MCMNKSVFGYRVCWGWGKGFEDHPNASFEEKTKLVEDGLSNIVTTHLVEHNIPSSHTVYKYLS